MAAAGADADEEGAQRTGRLGQGSFSFCHLKKGGETNLTD
jgi:hypothetical protein